MNATPHEEVAGQRSSRRMFDHLVNLQLVVPGSGFKEEVVREILDQIA